MYQYRNLPPRHQQPGFYPPHQPSLRRNDPSPSNGAPSSRSSHRSSTTHSPRHHHHHQHHYNINNQPLTRSHSHGIMHSHPPPPSHSHGAHNTHNAHNNHINGGINGGYRTHHIVSPTHTATTTTTATSTATTATTASTIPIPPQPDALYAIQQMQRIKAATACQIINTRVVEAIREQQQKKLQEKQLKKKLYPNWKDPNETNPNNPAYKGPANAKLQKLQSKQNKKNKKKTQQIQPVINTNDIDTIQPKTESMENDKMMTIPQLEISTAPKSTANITNLTDEELKMNPELYKMYSYYIPFATNSHSPSNLRSQSLPPHHDASRNGHHSGHHGQHRSSSNHHHRTNMGPRRHNPNFLKPQLITTQTTGDSVALSQHLQLQNGGKSQHNQHTRPTQKQAKLVPIGKPKPNPLERNPPNPIISKSAAKHHNKVNKHKQIANGQHLSNTSGSNHGDKENKEHNNNNNNNNNKEHHNGNNNNNKSKPNGIQPHIAPAHANVQSVISPNGGIYHPCHGYSTRDISIFDLFPAIVKYQSKKYNESDRVDYLVSLSEKSFTGVNNRPLKVDEAEMWYIALKYLFNDITLGQFDYMTVEMRYVIKQYMSTHKNRLSFLNSIKSYGFLRVISDVSKKLPREHIQKIIKQERERKHKQKLLLIAASEKLKQENARKLLQQQIFIQQQQQHAAHAAHAHHGQPPPPPHPAQPIYHQYPPPPHHHHHRYHQYPPQQYHHGQQIYGQQHYTDWYNGNKLKRTISEPTPISYSRNNYIEDEDEPIMNDMPAIIDDVDDIDDSWNFITEIVNENKIPDLPPEKTPDSKKKNNTLKMKKLTPQKLGFDDDDKMEIDDGDKSKSNENKKEEGKQDDDEANISIKDTKDTKDIMIGGNDGNNNNNNNNNNDDDDNKDEEMDEIVDVYTMMYQTMKDSNDHSNDNDDNKDKENEDDIKGQNHKLTPSEDDSKLIKIDDKASDSDEFDQIISDGDNNDNDDDDDNDTDLVPNVSFADLSDFANKPKTDDSFIPKLPFKWCNNNNSSSIWVDNPYAKPSKYFKSKKSNKYKRGKSQRK